MSGPEAYVRSNEHLAYVKKTKRAKRAPMSYARCVCGAERKGRHVLACQEAKRVRRLLSPPRDEARRQLARSRRSVKRAADELATALRAMHRAVKAIEALA